MYYVILQRITESQQKVIHTLSKTNYIKHDYKFSDNFSFHHLLKNKQNKKKEEEEKTKQKKKERKTHVLTKITKATKQQSNKNNLENNKNIDNKSKWQKRQ